MSEKSDSLPSNEEIIVELTKDIKQCAVKAADAKNGETSNINEHVGDVSVSTSQSNSVNTNANNLDTVNPTSGCAASDDVCESDVEETDSPGQDDTIDEEALKTSEAGYSEEEKKEKKETAEHIKISANDLFKIGKYREAAEGYTLALRTCPLQYENDRAILYSNRAAAKIKLDLRKEAVEDCSRAVELNPVYIKALLRRAQTFESLEKLDEALEDYKKILKTDPYHTEAMAASKRLPFEIEQRNEKMKTEMLSKLKDLGNMILRPFNLSTDNFQLNQDPNSGGYSINFKQNAN